MSAVSGRHGRALVAILAVALVPVAANTLRPRRHDPCSNPGALIATSLIPSVNPKGEQWDKRKNGVIQWSLGTIPVPGAPGNPLQFEIVRSYVARDLYQNTLGFAWKKVEAEDHLVFEVGGPGQEAPIHVVHDHTGRRSRTIAYLFIYGNRPVGSPFLYQLSLAPRELIFGQKPLTLVVVHGTSPRHHTEAVDSVARRFLGDAWAFYQRSCIQP